MRLLLLDNYDSFTFNLFQMLAVVAGQPPVVVRNDERGWPEISREGFDAMVISPGPGRPEVATDFGVCRDALQNAKVPILGVCLGHQGIGDAFGGRVEHAPEPVHGRASVVRHEGDSLFAGIPTNFQAVRYHSLTLARPLPEPLCETAWTEDGVLMGLRHRSKPIWGVQFHPESIGTEHGETLLANFVSLVEQAAGQGGLP